MARPCLFLCGPARLTTPERRWRDLDPVRLRIGREPGEVRLRIEALNKRLGARLPPIAADLLEVASYVYVADQMISRGGTKEFEYGERWRRHFRFEFAVRCPDIWRQHSFQQLLARTLGFLSDDDYEFGFSHYRNPPSLTKYLFDDLHFPPDRPVQEVVLFSAGMDSLGGAVQEVLLGQRKAALVSHRSNPKTCALQQALAAELARLVVDPSLRPLHVPVEVNKGKSMTHDFNQRTRSFLFAALGSVVARAFDLRNVQMYENGVLSIHLPLSPQEVGARASRSTHPQVLDGFGRIMSVLFDCEFTVQNPYLWKTKAEILVGIKAAGYGRLCARSVSCVRTIEMTEAQPHCGRCSQCVDRRIAALAAGLGDDEDPAGGYRSDVLLGPREGAELILIERYLGTARRIEQLANPLQFSLAYGELTRALRYCRVSPEQAALLAFDLYQHHAEYVQQGKTRAVAEYAAVIARGTYPPNSMLGLICGQARGRRLESDAAVAAQPSQHPAPAHLRLDSGTLAAYWGERECILGAGKEYQLLERLNQCPQEYVSHDKLRASVWQGHVEKNTIQRTVSNLRRRLQDDGLTGVEIDGKQAGHYRLMVGSAAGRFSA